MILRNKRLTDSYRSKRCEVCDGTYFVSGHHILSKGAGQVDHQWNLIALCLYCHNGTHYNGGARARAKYLELNAQTHRTTPDAIEQFVYAVRRAPKGSDIAALLADLNNTTRTR